MLNFWSAVQKSVAFLGGKGGLKPLYGQPAAVKKQHWTLNIAPFCEMKSNL